MDYSIENERHLPADFADRLIAHVHRRQRRERRLTLLVILAALIVASSALMGFLATPAGVQAPGEARLIAARTEKPHEQISGWMILGVFRECFECFKKNKPNKRKEEN
jgi:hypothetical protein